MEQLVLESAFTKCQNSPTQVFVPQCWPQQLHLRQSLVESWFCFSFQLPASCECLLCEAAGDSLRNLLVAIHVGDLDAVPSS